MSDILLRPIIAMQVAVHQLREREDGQTTTEYAILLGFLAIAIIIALFFLQERPAQPLLRGSPQRLAGTRLSTTPEPIRGCLCGSHGTKCAPARLPPRPGRCIRFSETVGSTPFGIGNYRAH